MDIYVAIHEFYYYYLLYCAKPHKEYIHIISYSPIYQPLLRIQYCTKDLKYKNSLN